MRELPCTLASQCNDNDSRTTDTCTSGFCKNTPTSTQTCTTVANCPIFPCYQASSCTSGFCVYNTVTNNIATLEPHRCRNESSCSFNLACVIGGSQNGIIRSSTLAFSLSQVSTAQSTFYCNQPAKLASSIVAATWTSSSPEFGPPQLSYTITAANCKMTAVITNNNSPNAALQYLGPWNAGGAACSYTIQVSTSVCPSNTVTQSLSFSTSTFFGCCNDGIRQSAFEGCDGTNACCNNCTCTAQNTLSKLYNGTCCNGQCASLAVTQPILIKEQACTANASCNDNDASTTNLCASGYCAYRPIGVPCTPGGTPCQQYPCFTGTCPVNICVYTPANNLFLFTNDHCSQDDSCHFDLQCNTVDGSVRASDDSFFLTPNANGGRIYCNEPAWLASQLSTLTWQYGTSSFGPPTIYYTITASACRGLTPVITNNNSPTAALQYTGSWNPSGPACVYTINATTSCGTTHTTVFNLADQVGCCGDSIYQSTAEFCDGQSCCTPQCTLYNSSTLCRAASGVCDLDEFCTGSSSLCPTDLVKSSSTVCRASAGICDVQETCTGTTKDCPADALRPAGFGCAAGSNTACTGQTVCTGSSVLCPSSPPFASNTTVCRPSTGTCDVLERCTGTSYGCPTDLGGNIGTVCRGAASVCDIAEVCTGATTCPGDVFANSSVVCRPAAGVCDAPEFCPGNSVFCPALDSKYGPTVVCRPAINICDVQETCNTGTNNCPADIIRSSLFECRAANASNCAAAAFCPQVIGGDCPASSPLPASTVCRSAVSVCDVQEVCTGTSTGCPTDIVASSSVVCRAAAGVCDVLERCTGSSNTCPVDVFANSSVICRASAGPCDLLETCGSGPNCPVDSKRPSGHVCLPAITSPVDNCDLDDVCNGVSNTCPVIVKSSGTVCRSSAGGCDVQEVCSGASTLCPTDVFVNSSVVCRPAAGVCDLPENCPGTGALCPTDLLRPSSFQCASVSGLCTTNQFCTGIATTCPSNIAPGGTPCNLDNNACTIDVCAGVNTTCYVQSTINYDDGQYCNGLETCNSSTGLVIPGTPVNCGDGNSCTTDSCDESTDSCVHSPVANSTGPCGPSTDVGLCQFGSYSCVGTGPTPVISCIGAVFPLTELCVPGGFDEDCDGAVDENCNTTACVSDGDCSGILVGGCEEAYCNLTITICQIRPKTNGVSCSDGLSCTVSDQCLDGLCVGTPVVCDDLNLCTQDFCVEPTGLCQYNGAVNEGLPCNADSNLCTTNDACNNQGQCIPGTTLTCPLETLPCQDLVCNPLDGICYAVNLTGLCSDGLACTLNDQCVGGECVGAPKVCNDFIPCTSDICQEPSGDCSYQLDSGRCYIDGVCYFDNNVNPADPCLVCNSTLSTTQWSYTTLLNVPCNDGLLCTTNDLCVPLIQQCTGTPVSCSHLDDECNVGVCSTVSGLCIAQPLTTGTPCDDNFFCTINDQCVGGFCQGSPRDCSVISTQCAAGVCDQGLDSCVLDPYQDGLPCLLTSTVCDGDEHCLAGECVPGIPPVCLPPTQCTVYLCDPDNGCLPSYLDQSTTCTDNNVCTLEDHCDGNGGCTPGQTLLNCDDNNDCTDDSCDSLLGCIHIPVENCIYCNNTLPCGPQTCYDVSCVGTSCIYTQQPQGTSCADNDVCNGQEMCDANGVCVSGSPLVCDDLNPCTDDFCFPLDGCLFFPNEFLPFDDGNACTINDRCSDQGVGISDPYPCPSATACESFSCQVVMGLPVCIATPINVGGSCDDGDACTGQDLCNNLGNCTGTPIVCRDPTQCEQNVVCIDGGCVPLFFGEDTPCETGNLCTLDACDGFGQCAQGPETVFCDPPSQCHLQGVCVPETGICTDPIAPNETPCNDGSACSQTDLCMEGQCVGTNHVQCVALDQCHIPGACGVETGLCSNPTAPDNTMCDDDNLCTVSDLCTGGVCVGYGALDCSNPNPCISTSCDTVMGCLQAYNSIPCDDGNACTDQTICVSGVCSSGTGTPVNCDDDNACTQDDCLPQSGCVHSPIGDCLPCDFPQDCAAIPCKQAQCVLHQCTYVTDDANIIGCLNSQFCDGQEQCVDGVCVHGTTPDCSDSNECTIDLCNYNLGMCTHESNVGTACTDSDLCSTYSVCDENGMCVPDQLVHCDPAPPCHVLVGCNPLTGLCDYIPLPDDSSCSDGNPCTQVDVCQSGTCVGTTPVHCDPLDQCHLQGVCNPQTGLCTNPVVADGTPCDDGYFCTSGDHCVAGQCGYESVYICNDVARDPQCQTVTCYEALDACVVEDLPSTTACDTGHPQGPCSGQDHCLAGHCQDIYTVGVVCREADLGGCDIPEFCGEDDLCPMDAKQPEGTPCLDDLFCADSTCHVGVCEPTIPRDCSSLDNQCQVGVCDEETNACVAVPRPDNIPCSSGNPLGPCVQFESCQSGQCLPHFAPVSTVCDDFNPCTIGDHCSGVNASCIPGAPNNCESSNTECTVGVCNVQTGLCESQPIYEGEPCGVNDNLCVVRTCTAGVCTPHFSDVSTPCQDSNLCTTGDHCSGYDSTCLPGAPISCTHLNGQCTAGICNPQSGLCDIQPTNEGQSCDADQNPCTENDVCQSGVCQTGTQKNCSYLNTTCGYGSCRIINGTNAECYQVVLSAQCDPNLCSGGCTLTQGYWSTHSKYARSKGLKVPWPQNMENTVICGKTWYEWTQLRSKGFAWRKLFEQYMAAVLNIRSGACVPLNLNASLTQATALLQQCNLNLLVSSPSAALYKQLASIFENYNSGQTGPGHCISESCTDLDSEDDDDGSSEGCRSDDRSHRENDDSHHGSGHAVAFHRVVEGEDSGVPPVVAFFEDIPTQVSCVNGQWDWISASCSCNIGWAGFDCTECDVPFIEGAIYLCVPTQTLDPPYLLRTITTDMIPDYIGPDAIVNVPGYPVVYPNTNGLDCVCRPTEEGVSSKLISRFEKLLVVVDDIFDWPGLWWLLYEQNLQACEITSFTNATNGTLCINTTINYTVPPHHHSDDDDDHDHDHHHHTLIIIFGSIFGALLLIFLCVWLVSFFTDRGVVLISEQIDTVERVGRKIAKQNPKIGEYISFDAIHND